LAKNISLFTPYSQAENRTTNYCLLVLKLLYEENPKLLGEAIAALAGEEIGEVVGVEFRQQERHPHSTPDGVIRQRGFTIYIETKNFDWFHDRQLRRHLDGLAKENPGLNILLALGNLDSLEGRFSKVQQLCGSKRYRGRVAFAAASFEDFLAAVRLESLPKNLADSISDFEDYLNDEDLLPRWKTRLDVVNCAGIPQEVLAGQVYLCPATGGAYSHKRAQYFGMYRDKRVSRIAQIEAVVDLESKGAANIKWKNVARTDVDLIRQAREKHSIWRPNRYPHRVFLLGELFETDFLKGTKYPMQGSKQYFDVSALNPSGTKDLAEKLRGKTWQNYAEGWGDM